MKTIKFLSFLFAVSIVKIANAGMGDLDVTFDGDGIVITDMNNGSSDVANSILIQGDGKIVAVGQYREDGNHASFALARYLSDGTLDVKFGDNGMVFDDFLDGALIQIATSAALQKDGKIVVAGFQADPKVEKIFCLQRYNTDGSLDNSFGTNGRVTPPLFHPFQDQKQYASRQEANAVTIQADGKIVIAGSIEPGGYRLQGQSPHFFALSRYEKNGDVDVGFQGGLVLTDFLPGSDSWASAVISLPNGQIVAAGTFYNAKTGYYDFGLARYNANGTLDGNFGTGGKVETDFKGFNDYLFGLALQPDGKLIAVGSSSPDNRSQVLALARYNSNGSLDGTFGNGGLVMTNNVVEGRSVTLKPNGKIIVAGGLSLAQYLPNGQLDPNFGQNGKVVTKVSKGPYSVTVQTDGKILVSGGSNDDFTVERYEGDACPNDPNKDIPGICGCGKPDIDSDKDTVLDCNDLCPGFPDDIGTADSDGDGVMNCKDKCGNTPQGSSVLPDGCRPGENDRPKVPRKLPIPADPLWDPVPFERFKGPKGNKWWFKTSPAIRQNQPIQQRLPSSSVETVVPLKKSTTTPVLQDSITTSPKTMSR